MRFRGGSTAAIAAVRIYQWVLSPALHALNGPGMGCRFEPSCSEYAAQAFGHHGLFRGAVLAARRISRCHPWGSAGVDPVPSPLIERK